MAIMALIRPGPENGHEHQGQQQAREGQDDVHRRMIRVSIMPPKKPEIRPITTPTPSAIETTIIADKQRHARRHRSGGTEYRARPRRCRAESARAAVLPDRRQQDRITVLLVGCVRRDSNRQKWQPAATATKKQSPIDGSAVFTEITPRIRARGPGGRPSMSTVCNHSRFRSWSFSAYAGCAG